MATPHHPNDFALNQEVLYWSSTHESWQQGTIIGVTVDNRTTRPTEDGDPWRENTHTGTCDGYLYGLAPQEYYSLPRGEAQAITTCPCEMPIVDADNTGRWREQRLTDPQTLALLRVDAHRRNEDIADVWVKHARWGNTIYLQSVHNRVTYAWVTVADLLAWASRIPAADTEKSAE